MKFRLPTWIRVPRLTDEHTMTLVRPVLPFFLGAFVVLNLQAHNHVMAGLTVVVWIVNVYSSIRLDRSVGNLLGALRKAHRIHLEAICGLLGALRAALGMGGAE